MTLGTKAVLIAAAVSPIAIALMHVPQACAQSPASSVAVSTARAAFQVASIKPDSSGAAAAHYRFLPGFNAENATLMNLISLAYDVAEFRISGGPGWMGSDRYDVEAKTEGAPNLDQKKLMIQTLLEDRFRLKVHMETRQLPIYALTVAKGGLKLQPVKEGSCIPRDPGNPTPPQGKTLTDYCGLVVSMGRGQMELGGAGMVDLARSLTRLTGRTVVDETGIKSVFAIHLTFSSDDAAPENPPADASTPSIFTAVQEQLGLKLESARGPVEVLVIDHVEKPSGN